MAPVPQVFMFLNCLIYFWHSDQCMDNIVKSCTGLSASQSLRLSKHSEEEDGLNGEGIPLRRQESLRNPWCISAIPKNSVFPWEGSFWCNWCFLKLSIFSRSYSFLDREGRVRFYFPFLFSLCLPSDSAFGYTLSSAPYESHWPT